MIAYSNPPDGVPAPLMAAIVSAAVSICIVGISRWLFARNDKRFPILVKIQQEILQLQAQPPTCQNLVSFDDIPKIAKSLQPYFSQLKMVSFPKRNCCVQRAWSELANFNERAWKQQNSNRPNNFSGGLSSDEFVAELEKILIAIGKCG